MNVEPQLMRGAYLYPNVGIGRNVHIFPGAVIGCPPLSTGATTRKVETGNFLPVEIGDGCAIGANAVIYMNTRIGHHTMICDTACVREGVVIGDYVVIGMGVTINYNTRIGNYVKIMDNAHVTGNMIIEDRVSIGMLVSSANDNTMGRTEPERPGDWKGPTIRRFATIGHGTCLNSGMEVGEDTIIGANSVVSMDIPARVLALGVPAKVVRSLKPHELRTRE